MLTVESVAAGHPDKLADQIADAILDEAIRENPYARTAIEVLLGRHTLHIAGEIARVEDLPYRHIARQVIADVGYLSYWPDITLDINTQSQVIGTAVDSGGAGDQGIVYGYACNETPSLMPLAVVQAHEIIRVIGAAGYGPDGKAQVAFDDNVFVSVNGVPDVDICPAITRIVGHSQIYVSFFTEGGPLSDTGLTGRKTQVDTYGGIAHHGGGGFSGKDATKLDRSGAYFARYLAREILQREGSEWVEVGLAYGFGVRDPLWVHVRGTAHDGILAREIREEFDLSIPAIIERLQLRRPIYRATSTGGHFGRPEFSWEQN